MRKDSPTCGIVGWASDGKKRWSLSRSIKSPIGTDIVASIPTGCVMKFEAILLIAAAFTWRVVFAVLSHRLRANAFGRVRNISTKGSAVSTAIGMVGFLAILLTGLILAIRQRMSS
jgi:hypothetical protein